MTLVNAQCRLAARPVGLPKPSDWDYVEEPAPEPGDGEFLVEVEYISLDPAMRAWMNDGRSYIPPVRDRRGDARRRRSGAWSTRATPTSQVGESGVRRVRGAALRGLGRQRRDPGRHRRSPRRRSTSATLGMSGLTAYFGLLDVGRPEPGQTVVVSGAAGSVGSVVGQIAKIKGCRAVGIAGGPEKCRWLVEELGFDAAIDYKAGDVRSQLREHAPDGVDVFFDNVGGEILDAVLLRLARGARVVICGAISQYNATEPPRGPANYMQLLVTRASMTGFVVFDYADRYRRGASRSSRGWLRTGELRSREDVVQGDIEQFPDVLLRLFRGENTGKLVLAV